MTIAEALDIFADRLSRSGVPEPRKDAATLLSHTIGHDQIFLIAHSETKLSTDDEKQLMSLIERRARREPIQYITGHQEFYRLDFVVTPDVLIPRPETEFLVEEATKILRGKDNPRFCEIGVGSGCISVAMLRELPSATAVGVDISGAALTVAHENAVKHRVGDRLELIISDVFDRVGSELFDAIVSNPPYVPVSDVESLQAEVRDYEPAVALTDGKTGLTIIERIVREAPSHLNQTGSLLIEIGFDQADKVRAMFDPAVWAKVNLVPDLQAIPRIISTQRRA